MVLAKWSQVNLVLMLIKWNIRKIRFIEPDGTLKSRKELIKNLDAQPYKSHNKVSQSGRLFVD
jgi:hypothetical protein